jgi:hypothetical protein
MTKSAPLPNLEILREWLAYDPLIGQVVWVKDRWYNARKGQVAGAICPTTGYRRIRLGNKKKLQAHRVVWTLCTGADPFPLEVDHINGNRQDNKIENLRLVDKRQNQLNRSKINKNNTTGHAGVYAYRGKWKAGLAIDGKFVSVGVFDSKEEASEAWHKAHYQRQARAGLVTASKVAGCIQVPRLDAA